MESATIGLRRWKNQAITMTHEAEVEQVKYRFQNEGDFYDDR